MLEARAASAQAQYELVSIKGLEEISRGGLATVLGVSPATEFAVEDVSKLLAPDVVGPIDAVRPIDAVGPIEVIMRRGLAQRPDLLAQVARIRSAEADVEQARAAYYPVLSVFADWGHRNPYGSQLKNPWVSAQIYPYSAELNFNWTIFDGGARRNELARAKAARREMEARATASRDQIED